MGSARSGVIIEVVANGPIPSNPDRHPYVSFTTSNVKSRWDPHASKQEFADRTCISSIVEMSIAKEIRSAEHR